MARSAKESQPKFGATFGTPDDAGTQLLDCAIAAGLGGNTQVHAVGDGAQWIANTVIAQFGNSATYLLDFYHLSEYLAAASIVCAPSHPDIWLQQQQQLLKRNGWQQVLAALHPNLEPSTAADEQAPVRAAYRYIQNRSNQLDYQGAIAADLPIGSGEIESASSLCDFGATGHCWGLVDGRESSGIIVALVSCEQISGGTTIGQI